MMLLLPLFDLAISLPGMLTKSAIISSPTVLEQNAEGFLTITVVHLRPFPIRCLELKLQIIQDEIDSKLTLYCSADPDERNEIPIDTTKTGLTIIELSRLTTVSLLGLFSMKIKTGSEAKILILPPPMMPSSTIELPRGVALQPKAGGGFSEEHDMRQYRSGDSIKSVHWKISAKYDELIVREPLVPPNHSRLVNILRWGNQPQRDLILGRLRYICEYLLEREMAFYVKYADKEVVAEVMNEEDLMAFLRNVLDAKGKERSCCTNLPARFAWTYQIDAKESVSV